MKPWQSSWHAPADFRSGLRRSRTKPPQSSSAGSSLRFNSPASFFAYPRRERFRPAGSSAVRHIDTVGLCGLSACHRAHRCQSPTLQLAAPLRPLRRWRRRSAPGIAPDLRFPFLQALRTLTLSSLTDERKHTRHFRVCRLVLRCRVVRNLTETNSVALRCVRQVVFPKYCKKQARPIMKETLTRSSRTRRAIRMTE